MNELYSSRVWMAVAKLTLYGDWIGLMTLQHYNSCYSLLPLSSLMSSSTAFGTATALGSGGADDEGGGSKKSCRADARASYAANSATRYDGRGAEVSRSIGV